MSNDPLVQHEAQHTAYLACDMIDNWVLDNDFVKNNPELDKLAKQAHEALMALYQAIGER